MNGESLNDRRERIATAVLVGIAACDDSWTAEGAAKNALRWADALIEQLAKRVPFAR